jgi:small-conductance mechanosensitive channel
MAMTMDDVHAFLETTLVSFGDFNLTVGQLVVIPLFIVIGLLMLGWAVGKTTSTLKKREASPDLIQIIRRAVYVLGLIIIGITTLDLLEIPLTAFAFVSGAVAIGVGFGAQNIINNFISGWILISERPIRINDYIELGATTGTVEQINTRSTRIRRVDGVHMLVPNSKLLEETVVNWTLVDKLLRCIVRVGVQYGSDVQKVRSIMQETSQAHALVLNEPACDVIFEDFGDNALIFDLYFWVSSAGERNGRQIRSDIRFALEEAFEKAGIVVAYPQRDVHLDGNLRILKDSD